MQKAPTDGKKFILFSGPVFSAWMFVTIFFRHQFLYKSLLVCKAIKHMMERDIHTVIFVEQRLTVSHVNEIMGSTCSKFWTIDCPKRQL